MSKEFNKDKLGAKLALHSRLAGGGYIYTYDIIYDGQTIGRKEDSKSGNQEKTVIYVNGQEFEIKPGQDASHIYDALEMEYERVRGVT